MYRLFKDLTIVFTVAALGMVAIANHLKPLALRIETDIASRIQQSLQAQDFNGVTVNVEGRDVTVTGMAENSQEYAQVSNLLQSIEGVRQLHNEIQIKIQHVNPYTLTANYQDQVLTITGYMPDATTQVAFSQHLQTSFPQSTLQSALEIAAGEPAHWQSAMFLAFENLAKLERARLEVTNYNLRLSGVSKTTAELHLVEKNLQALKEKNYQINLYLQAADEKLPPKRVNPYTFVADYKDSELRVVGYAPTQETRQAIITAARNLFASEHFIDGGIQIASGEPAQWKEIIEILLESLRQFLHGRLEISNYEVRLTGEVPTLEIAEHLQQLIPQLLEQNYHVQLYIQSADAQIRLCQAKFNALLNSDTIRFDSNSAIIQSNSYVLLDQLIAAMKTCPSSRITIGGHTDAIGDTEKNQQLSQERADAVKEYLVNHGVNTALLKAIGYGESRPLTRGDDPDLHAKNRRIELTVEGY